MENTAVEAQLAVPLTSGTASCALTTEKTFGNPYGCDLLENLTSRIHLLTAPPT